MRRKVKNLLKDVVKCGTYTALGLVIVYAAYRRSKTQNIAS